jgi:hypothetical protein
MIAQLTMDVQPIEVDGKWWVDVSLNGRKMKRRGPFLSADAAKIAADKFLQHWRPTPNVPAARSDVVVLHGKPVALDSDEGRKFVTDATRAAEGLIDDKMLQEVYKISPSDWKNIAENKTLADAIRDEGRRRVNNGQRAKEAAAQSFVKSPGILDSIMTDTKASARHRIEACKEIRTVAIGTGSAESTVDSSEKFVIRIDLSAGGGEVFERSTTVNPPKQIEGELDADERV